MAKRDRDYENRMAGYISAYNLAKNEGIEALEKDLRMRNLLKVDLKVPGKLLKENFEELSKKLIQQYFNSCCVDLTYYIWIW